MKNIKLRHKNIWLLIGWSMVFFVVFETLTSAPIGTGMHISDKFLHIAGYFCMMGWFVQIFHRGKDRIFLAIGFVSMGITLEFLQGWGGIRQFEVADMIANATGVLLAWGLSITRFSDILLALEGLVGNQREVN